jgi:membrane protein required for colicin V production
MSAGAGLTGYDLVVIGFFALLVLRGIWLGFLKQITCLVALYLGYLVAGQYHDRIFPFLKEISSNPKVVFFTAYVIVFVAVYVAVMLLGKGLAYVVQLTLSGWFDKMLGGLLGAAKALLLIIIIHMVLTFALPPENKMLTTCRTCNALNKTTAFALDMIKDQEIKKVLVQRNPPISAQDVKDFFDTPPKAGPDSEKSVPGKSVDGKTTPDKAEKQPRQKSSSI